MLPPSRPTAAVRCLRAIIISIPTMQRASLVSSPPSPSPSNSHQRKPLAFALLLIGTLRGRPALLNVSPLISQPNTHTMADADASSLTSLAHTTSTTTQTSLVDSGIGHSQTSAPNVKNDRRASLGLIDAARMRFSMDVSPKHAPFPLTYHSKRRA